jgi:hypothetical protein
MLPFFNSLSNLKKKCNQFSEIKDPEIIEAYFWGGRGQERNSLFVLFVTNEEMEGGRLAV